MQAQIINDSSLVLHYDAGDLDGNGIPDSLVGTTKLVNQWTDTSANGLHAFRNGANENVYLLPNAFNGRPAVHFGTVHGVATAPAVDQLISPLITAEKLTGVNRDEISVLLVMRRHGGVVHFQWQTGGANRVGFEGASRWDWSTDAVSPGGRLVANFQNRGEPFLFEAIRTPATAAVPRTQ